MKDRHIRIGDYVTLTHDLYLLNKIILKETIGVVADILNDKNKIIIEFPKNPRIIINIHNNGLFNVKIYYL